MSNVLVVAGHPGTGDDSVAKKTNLEELASLRPGGGERFTATSSLLRAGSKVAGRKRAV